MALNDIRIRAVVIGSEKTGEIHKRIRIISPEIGLQDVMIYGGRKGKKTASGTLFSFGDLLVHADPLKKKYSLLEDECSFSPQRIFGSVSSVLCASALCEVSVLFKTDDYSDLFALLVSSFAALEGKPELYNKICIDFCWKILQMSGSVDSLFEKCPSCGRMYGENEELAYSFLHQCFVCLSCTKNTDFRLPPGARRYLKYTSAMNLEDCFSVELSPAAEKRILRILKEYMEVLFQIKVNSLNALINVEKQI